MSDNIAAEVTREFSEIFTTLSSRVEVFQTTQKGFLDGLKPKIAETLPELNDEELEVTAAIYGIALTDEAIKGYEAEQFAQDIKYLRSLIEDQVKSEDSKLDQKGDEDFSTDDSSEESMMYDDKDHPILKSNRKDNESKIKPTLAERVTSAKERETTYMLTLTAYYQSNNFIERSMIGIQNDIILHQVNFKPELIITSMIIREHFLPIYEHVIDTFENVPLKVDLRFVTAQIRIALDRLLDSDSELKSEAEVFVDLKDIYPLGHGDDLYWDLSEQLLWSKYYEPLKEMLQPQIEEARREREEARKTMLSSMERAKIQPQQGSTESIRAKVDSLIFETLHFDRKFDDTARMKMKQAVESVLKRMALKEFGIQDIPEMEKFKNYFNKEFFKPIFSEYPQLYLDFIDIRHYREFSEDPLGHVEENEHYILNQFHFNMRKYGAGDRANAQQLAHAFSMVLYDVLNNPKVREFTI